MAGDHRERALRYRAFISYSHHDAGWGRWLHRKLEMYRLPPHLAGKGIPRGSEANRLNPIFRDREELPAAGDLSEKVRAALEASDALIVICSPAAAASPWVGREIELFRRLHPERQVLAALIAGDPRASFPPFLACDGREPLAADFRPDGDGKRLALLKIIAGMLSIPLDALIQRDAQRRQRRVMFVTAATMLMTLILSVMTILAINARTEAERQRAEAEGLVEFMLTDLRDGLKGVGRLDLMRRVNARALSYYRDIGRLSDLPDASLERRARVIGAMGEDAENGGELKLAEAHYRELYRTTAELLSQDPQDPGRMFSHAQSENRLALLAHSTGRRGEAAQGFLRSRHLLVATTRWGREKPEWLRLSSYVSGNLCVILQERGRSAAARRFCREAVNVSERLAKLRPEDRSVLYDLAFHSMWLAEADAGSGAASEASRLQHRYLELTDGLVAADPENFLWGEQQMELYTRHAKMLQDAGRPAEARRFLERARRINRRLADHDPENAGWARYREKLSKMMKGAGT